MIRYDFPHRLRTPGAAWREAANLRRSLSIVTRRGDNRAADYLQRRLDRLTKALRRLNRPGPALTLGPGE